MSVKIVIYLMSYYYTVFATDFTRLDLYEVKVRSVGDCQLESTAYDPEGGLHHKFQIYKKSRYNERIRGELSIPRDGMQLHVSIDAFCWLESGFNKMIDTVRVDCRHPTLRLLYDAMNIPLDNNCTFQAGIYKFDDLGVNTLMHQMVKTMFLGRFKFVLRFRSERALVLCVETVVDTTPIKQTGLSINPRSLAK